MPPRSKQSSATSGAVGAERRKTPRTRVAKVPHVDVTAVLVSHDGERWLPAALQALASSTRTPARVLCVDTGSTDRSVELLAASYGAVLELPRDTGFGAAVAAGLEGAPRTQWVWLLHDDCAVEPTTLQALLEHVELSPSAALLGPKVRDWNDPRVLVEVGVTTDAAGHRETGLERREYDQGQHDDVREVLAVGTAGALVRRDVWDAVGGLDPELPIFRDDLDLGWKVNAAGHRVVVVPEARIRHARAATTGRRATDAAPGSATGTDRKNALFVLLAHAGLLRLVGLLPRLLAATAIRALGLLLTRQVSAAADEIRALATVLGRPGRLAEARRTRAATRTVSTRQLRPLFASRTVRIRARTGAVGDWLSGGLAPGVNPLGALGDPGPEGSDELAELSVGGSGTLRRVLMRPAVQLVLALSAVALIAERSVLRLGGGILAGGALLPSPRGARDLWAAYLGAWHPTSVGSGSPAPPGTAVLAALSSVLFGKPSLAVDVLLLASVPLAGLTAYLAAGRLVRHLYLRLWAAATWALLPVATGAVAAGRLDAAALQIGLPLLAVAGGRLLHEDPHLAGWWRAWSLGIGLSLLAAFAPLLWPLCAVVLLTGAVVNFSQEAGRRRAWAAVLVAVVPLGALFPWSLSALRHPSLFVPGPQVADAALPTWHLLLLSPGGPGLPAVLITAGIVLAAVGGTIREDNRRVAQAAWGVALVGLLAAGVVSRLRVEGSQLWPGVALQLSAVMILAAALVAGNGVRNRLSRGSFGWRQLLAGLVAAAAAAAPVLAAGAWVLRGADDPLRRDVRPLLPAFAVAELAASPGLRMLVLAPMGGRLSYDLTGSSGTLLDSAGIVPEQGQQRALDAVVADLASPRGSDAAEALSTRAVRYVVLRDAPGANAVASALDAQAGLVRRTSGAVVLWQVLAPSARLSILPPAVAELALGGARAPTAALLRTSRPTALPSGREGANATVSAGGAGRLLVLAEARDPGWRASIGGKQLPRRTAWGWAQGFELPAAGGQVELSHSQTGRQLALFAQVSFLLVAAVLSAPGARRRRGLVDDLEEAEDRHDHADQVDSGPVPVVAAVSSAEARSAPGAASAGLDGQQSADVDDPNAVSNSATKESDMPPTSVRVLPIIKVVP